MRDYLSDIVTKNIGTANVVVPRRRGRFEPVQTKIAPLAEIELPPFQVESLEETRRREAKLSEKAEIKFSRNDSDEQIERALFVAPPKMLAPEIIQNNAPLTAFKTAREKSANSSLSVQNRTSSAPSIAPLESFESREKSDGATKFAPVQTVRLQSAQTNEPKIPVAENSAKQDIQTRGSIIVKPRVGKTRIRQTILPTPRQSSPQQIQEGAAAETTTINITIGRVEIRAVGVAAPPKTTTPNVKPPTLSLDEFLRKRRVGGDER